MSPLPPPAGFSDPRPLMIHDAFAPREICLQVIERPTTKVAELSSEFMSRMNAAGIALFSIVGTQVAGDSDFNVVGCVLVGCAYMSLCSFFVASTTGSSGWLFWFSVCVDQCTSKSPTQSTNESLIHSIVQYTANTTCASSNAPTSPPSSPPPSPKSSQCKLNISILLCMLLLLTCLFVHFWCFNNWLFGWMWMEFTNHARNISYPSFY